MSEVALRAGQYLQAREEELERRHDSKVRRDLRRCATWLEKVIAWTEGAKAQRATGRTRVENSIACLIEIAHDPSMPAFLREGSRLEIAGAIRQLRQIAAKIRSNDVGGIKNQNIQDLHAFLITVESHIDQSRLGKSSRRQSQVRRVFLNQLVKIFVGTTGARATYSWDDISGEADSPFTRFAKEVFLVVDPEIGPRGLDSEIYAAVRRQR